MCCALPGGQISDAIRKDDHVSRGDSLEFALFATTVSVFLGGLAFLWGAKYIPGERSRASVVHPQTDFLQLNSDADKIVEVT